MANLPKEGWQTLQTALSSWPAAARLGFLLLCGSAAGAVFLAIAHFLNAVGLW